MTTSDELLERGLSIQDGFLSVADVADLRDCLEVRRTRGDFAAARIGGSRSLQRREEIRGDSICWIGEPLFPAEVHLLESLEVLRLKLNREAFLGLLDLELHYASYPPGAAYARHVDQPRGTRRRKLSLALYLNERWPPDAGGELRIFRDGERHLDVQPVAGRLVCFLTAHREHCVLAAQHERLSVSGWFGTRE